MKVLVTGDGGFIKRIIRPMFSKLSNLGGQSVLYPFLLTGYPILFLLAKNIGKFEVSEVFLPLIIATCSSLIAWLILSKVMRNKEKAGLLISFSVLLFFTYGHVSNVIRGFDLITGFGVNKFLYISFGLLFLIGTFSILMIRSDLRKSTSFLNLTSAILLALPLFTIITTVANSGNVLHRGALSGNPQETDFIRKCDNNSPSIYYIILDGYARDDVLKEVYGIDNGEFINYLSEMGFYIASDSHSNYAQTGLSLASSLNYSYLDNVAERLGNDSDNRVPLGDMIRHSYVSDFLRRCGYLFITFSTGYTATEIRDADLYLTSGISLNEFQNALINSTPLPILLEKIPGMTPTDLHRRRVLFTIEHLSDAATAEDPVFVFAHIISPHPPFVFDKEGNAVNDMDRFSMADGYQFRNLSREEYIERYRMQLLFINNLVMKSISRIIANSAEPPIIILQSDHGPGSSLKWEQPDMSTFTERLSIMNAYHLPGNGKDFLYSGITPVNTFRIIFNYYFNCDIDLLDDRSFFSSWSHPYQFLDVTELIN